MIAFTIASLVAIVAVATLITLVDCWLRARNAYASLARQHRLIKAGFVPQVEAQVVRLRPSAPRSAAATRPFATRLPKPLAKPLAQPQARAPQAHAAGAA